MQLNPSEISELIKERIEKFESKPPKPEPKAPSSA